MTTVSLPPSLFARHVYIPTTKGGPVRITSIIHEEEKSTAHIGGSWVQAGMSPGYHAFVKRPGGVVNRVFNREPYPFYRLDLEDNVDIGESWELAVFIAHGCIAHDPGRDDDLIWATATVSNDLRVGAVAEISRKLLVSRELFEDARDEGRKVHVILSKENEVDLEANAARMLEGLGIVPTFVSRVDAALAVVGLPPVEAAAASKPKATSDVWKGNPFPNLQPYDRAHRAVFFGRSRAREEAGARLKASFAAGRPFLLVHGESGAGKSSFVRAGVAGDMEDHAADPSSFRTQMTSPRAAETPLAALLDAMGKLVAPKGEAAATLRSAFAVVGALAGIHADPEAQPTLLLVVDQLEEVLDASVPPLQVAEFDSALADIVLSGRVWVVATIRSDAIGQLDRLPRIAKLTTDERTYRLKSPTPSELVSIVSDPVLKAGGRFEDDRIVDELVEAAAGSPDSLPLLQVVMFRFFDFSSRDRILTRGTLDTLGGFEGAIALWADRAFGEIVRQGTDAATVDAALVSLVRVDPETRKPMSRTAPLRADSATRGALSELVEKRLATRIDGPDGPRVRLAHEALLTRWPHMADLVAQAVTALAIRDQVESRTTAWKQDGGDLLARGSLLTSAEALVADPLVSLSATAREFIAASAFEAGRAQRRRKIATWVGSVAAAMIVALAAGAGWQQLRLTRQADALTAAGRERSLMEAFSDAARADAFLRQGNAAEAVRYASRALIGHEGSSAFIPSAYQTLYRLVYGSGIRRVDVSPLAESTDVKVLPLADGTLMFVSPSEARVWSPEAGMVAIRGLDRGLRGPTVAPDGSAVIFATEEGNALRYRVDGRKWDIVSIYILDAADPGVVAASANVMMKCIGGRIDKFQVGEGGKDWFWIASTEDIGCRQLAIVDGSLLALVQEVAGFRLVEFDPDTLVETARYEPFGKTRDQPEFINARSGTVVVSEGAWTTSMRHVFRRGVTAPVGSFYGDNAIVSLDGSKVAWHPLTDERGHIDWLDVERGIKSSEKCADFCQLGDFRSDGTLIVRWGEKELASVDLAKPSAPRIVSRLQTSARVVVTVPSLDIAVALHPEAQASVVSLSLLGDQERREMVAAGPGNSQSSIFLADDQLFVSGRRNGTDVSFYDLGKGLPTKRWVRNFEGQGALIGLDENVLAVVTTWDTGFPKAFHLVQGTTGAIIWSRELKGPVQTGDGHHLFIPTEEGLFFFDVDKRTFELLESSVPTLARFIVSGNTVFYAADGGTRSFDSETRMNSLLSSSVAKGFCVAGEFVYVLTATGSDGDYMVERRHVDVVKRQDWPSNEVPDIVAIEDRRYGYVSAGELVCDSGSISDKQKASSLFFEPAPPVAPRPFDFDTSVAGRIAFRDADGKERVLVFGPTAVSSTAVARDRKMVFAGLQNGDLLAWDLASDDTPMIEVKAHGSPVVGLAVSPSEKALATWDGQGNVRVWPLPTVDELLATARPQP